MLTIGNKTTTTHQSNNINVNTKLRINKMRSKVKKTQDKSSCSIKLTVSEREPNPTTQDYYSTSSLLTSSSRTTPLTINANNMNKSPIPTTRPMAGRPRNLAVLSVLAVIFVANSALCARPQQQQIQLLQSSTATAALAAAVAAATTASPPLIEPLAPLSSARTSENVIIIRYANVSSTSIAQTTNSQQSDTTNLNEAAGEELKIFKLFNEPLSVDVIESKFSSSIQLFDVSQNMLATLSKDLFCPLSNDVKSLNISHNLLENFDCLGLISQAGQLCLSELRVLDMSHNLIKHLPATGVATLQNLEILNLSNNLIDTLDELSLSSLFKLSSLDLSFNRLVALSPRTFHKSTSMQILKLAHNSIQLNINQNLLYGLTALEFLDFSFNNISHVSDNAFTDKHNLSRVDLRFNSLTSIRQDALRVTSVKQAVGYRHRVHHNGQYAGVAPRQSHSQAASAEFFLSGNPLICDCQLEWLKKINTHKSASTTMQQTSAAKLRLDQQQDMLADQPLSYLAAAASFESSRAGFLNQPQMDQAAADQQASTSNVSEMIVSPPQQQHDSSSASVSGQSSQLPSTARLPMATLLSSASQHQQALHRHQQQQQQQQQQLHYAKVADLDMLKCSTLFQRNTLRGRQLQQLQPNHHHPHHRHPHGAHRALAPSDGAESSFDYTSSMMIDLASADSSNFLCRYRSHCFAMCQCCEFEACDCEMMCPDNCNCYYDATWQTNIVDCSANNHSDVPKKIPMDVSGLYLDGNNISSLKPHGFIGRKSMRMLYLNATSLEYIGNRSFNGLTDLQVLHLNDNLLRSLHGYEFESLAQLRVLYLQSNRLEHINNLTFINLRSLEVLDLSQNRLTSATNLQLFWSIGHHNVRLRQLFIAHNWWSCQCNLIKKFRQILANKFTLSSIADKGQLRCYYNATTVGPAILPPETGNDANSAAGYQLYPLSADPSRQLNEVSQCSDDLSEDLIDPMMTGANPPQIASPQPPARPTPLLPPASIYPPPSINDNQRDMSSDDITPMYNNNRSPLPYEPSPPNNPGPVYQPPPRFVTPGDEQQRTAATFTGVGSLLLVTLFGAIVFGAATSFLVFARQQQRRYQSHHKKSSSGSTTSAASSVSSSTANSLGGKHPQHLHIHHPYHQHHLIMSNTVAAGGADIGGVSSTLARFGRHHQHPSSQHLYHQASQSNIYAAVTSPIGTPTATHATNTAHHHHQQQQQHHHHQYNNSSSSNNSTQWISAVNGDSIHNFAAPQIVGSSTGALAGAVNSDVNSQYATNGAASSQASYKVAGGGAGSLYNSSASQQTPYCLDDHHRCGSATSFSGAGAQALIRLPKVKQFVSKLVNKSLALGGYRPSASRDELSAIASSDKIYDAFISYDKQDELFVTQYLSRELEHGDPQYRIANRYNDLPAPSSAYLAEAIASVVGCSQRTICVLSDAYLANHWCRVELQAALRETQADKTHKIIAIVLEPNCLANLDNETRALLAFATTTVCGGQNQMQAQMQMQMQQQQQQQQLVQLDNNSNIGTTSAGEAQLVATLLGGARAGKPQHVATSACSQQQTLHQQRKVHLLDIGERKYWPQQLRTLMPQPRPMSQALTLTTKN